MALYPIGHVIKRKREEQGLSQEDLADGICSAPTLSRIESGQRFPSKANFVALMERLGYSIGNADIFVSEEEIKIHELQFKIRQEGILKHYPQMKTLLDKMEHLVHIHGDDPAYIQFITMHRILCEDADTFPAAHIPALEEALRMTIPKYGKISLQKLFLSFDELLLAHTIAIYCCENGELEKGLGLYHDIKEYMEERILNAEERMRLYPAIIYNMGRYLAKSGRYQECIDFCLEGIRILTEHNRMQLIYLLSYTIAWCYEKLDRELYRKEIIRFMLQAYYFAQSIQDEEVLHNSRQFLETHFPEEAARIYW